MSGGRSRGARVVRGAANTPALALSPRDGRVRVSEMQRSRLLGGAVAAVEVLGWSNVTVASISSRARVSRRTFYELFSDREDCLLEVCEDTSERIARELTGANLGGLAWRERVRSGLWTILSFFDREPELARLCVVQSARGGRGVQEWREGVLARLTALVDEGRLQGARAAQVPVLSAEGSVGAVLTIIHRRLLDVERVPLGELLGSLVGMVVLPYLGAAAARSERTRPAPQAPSSASGARAYRAGQDPLRDVPMRLTYRTARVLEAAATHPGASNRHIGEQADMHDQGQVSKLLARLQRIGLLANTGKGHARGEANSWSLTELGQRVIEQLALDTHLRQEDAAA